MRIAAALLLCPLAQIVVAGPPARDPEGAPFRAILVGESLAPEWYVATYDHPGGWFRTSWQAEASDLTPQGLHLRLRPRTEADGPAETDGPPKTHVSGQVQRRGWFRHGRYEVVMQPAKGDGLISSFYTYTGPYFDAPHDEIDIEFLGRDTTKIHLNIFVDGKPLADPPWIELGFDAADRPRLYGFEWQADQIVWLVDGAPVHRIRAQDAPLPDAPGKIYFDLWAGGPGQKEWSGQAAPDAQAAARYLCVSYSPLHLDTPECSDIFGPQAGAADRGEPAR